MQCSAALKTVCVCFVASGLYKLARVHYLCYNTYNTCNISTFGAYCSILVNINYFCKISIQLVNKFFISIWYFFVNILGQLEGNGGNGIKDIQFAEYTSLTLQ